MLEDIKVPVAFDIYDLQSVLLCDHCQEYLGSRPVTTRCGHSFCRDCLVIAGKCLKDGCRTYSADDCPHDVVLGDLLEEIHRIITDSDSKGVWRKRKRAAPTFVKRETHSDAPLAQGNQDGAECQESPDSLESLQLRYKKIDNEPSPPKPPVGTPGGPPDSFMPGDPHGIQTPEDLDKVDDALSQINSDKDDASSHLTPNTSHISNIKSEGGKSTPPVYSPRGLQDKGSSKRMEVLYKQEEESKDNDLWKILRRNVAESFFTCSVCSNCFLEPMTLRCGHTFCRECLHHSIDQSSYHSEKGFSPPSCPSCRSLIGPLLPVGEAAHHENTWNWTNNLHMWKLINICWIPELEDSKLNYLNTARMVPRGMDYPLFICTTALPTQPMDLRVFEAKYRTMLRRVLRTKERSFVMSLGTGNASSPFKQVATLVQIKSVVYQELEVAFPDTTPATKDTETYVYTRGVSRVKIEDHVEHDGYWTVRTSPISDIDAQTADDAERDQVGYLRTVDPQLASVDFDADRIDLDWFSAALYRYQGAANRLRNHEIMKLIRQFVSFEEVRTGPEKWLSDIIEPRGPLPDDSHAADFTWWIIGLFFRSQKDRQLLLEMTSPRDRLIFLVNRIGRAWPRLR